MDFDDLDDAIDARLAAGEELQGAAARLLASRPKPGSYDPAVHPPRPGPHRPSGPLPPIPRNRRLPGVEQLQDLVSNRLQKDRRREVSIRVFAFSGAGDMAGAWGDIMRFAPPFMEVALHEWPSHGIREDEPPCETLADLARDAFKGLRTAVAQHAVGGALEGAPFALLGHSVGCLLMTEVAALLRAELGLEPALVVALDRAAPHVPMFTSYGEEKMRTSPDEFMRLYNAEIFRCAQAAGGERGQRMLRMWIDDVRYANEVRPAGFHTFECDLLVLIALHSAYVNHEVQVDKPDPLKVEAHRERDKLMNSSPGSAMDYDFDQFDGWEQWTSGVCTIEGVETDHLNIKSHPAALDLVYNALQRAAAAIPC